MQSALCGNVAKSSEKEGEAHRFFERVISKGTVNVVIEGEGDEDYGAQAHDKEVAIRILSLEGQDCQCDEAKDNDEVVDQVEDAFGANQERSNEETKEWNGKDNCDFAAVAAQKSCGFKVKQGRNRYEIVAGDAQVAEEVGRRHQQGDETELEPQAQIVEDS